MKRYVVEGRYLDPEDGSITVDYILAEDIDIAVREAQNARDNSACNGWEGQMVSTFDEYIAEQKRIIAGMESMTDDQIVSGWNETKNHLLVDSRQDDAEELGRKLARKDGH